MRGIGFPALVGALIGTAIYWVAIEPAERAQLRRRESIERRIETLEATGESENERESR